MAVNPAYGQSKVKYRRPSGSSEMELSEFWLTGPAKTGPASSVQVAPPSV